MHTEHGGNAMKTAGVAMALLLGICLTVPLAACGGGEEASPTPTVPMTQVEGRPPAVPGEPTVSASGLQFIDIKVGTGDSPQPGQTVEVHYSGWLADGTKFDSSLDRGQPFDFLLGAGRVIPGWDEGVASMKVGDKRRLIIPPELGYGERGYPPVIPPNAQLIFDLELLNIRSQLRNWAASDGSDCLSTWPNTSGGITIGVSLY
jgi:peptidylprolyl isomerase